MNSNKPYLIRICLAGPCKMSFADDLLKQAEKLTADHPHIQVQWRSCMNFCRKAPNIEIVDPEKESIIAVHHSVMPNDLSSIIQGLIEN